MTHKVAYLSTDTTGFKQSDELLRVTVLNHDGNILLNKMVHPLKNCSWPEAQQIHGITPDDVDMHGITRDELAEQLLTVLQDITHIVMYNAEFHLRFLPWAAITDKKIVCAMHWSLAYINNHPSYASLGTFLKLPVLASFLEVEESELARNSMNNCMLTRKVWIEMYANVGILENDVGPMLQNTLSAQPRECAQA